MSNTEAILLASLGIVGAALTFLGITELGERPHDDFLWGLLAVGAVLVLGAIVWAIGISRRSKREQQAGHYPRLSFSVGRGRTLLDTHNELLVEELLALNTSARRLPTPLLWRKR